MVSKKVVRSGQTGNVLKLEQTVFPDRLDIWRERKRLKDSSGFCGSIGLYWLRGKSSMLGVGRRVKVGGTGSLVAMRRHLSDLQIQGVELPNELRPPSQDLPLSDHSMTKNSRSTEEDPILGRFGAFSAGNFGSQIPIQPCQTLLELCYILRLVLANFPSSLLHRGLHFSLKVLSHSPDSSFLSLLFFPKSNLNFLLINFY